MFIYDSIKLINLINGLRRSKEGSNERGSIIKSNTSDEEFVNEARLIECHSHNYVHFSAPGYCGSVRRHREPQQRSWRSVHGFH